MFWDLIWNTVSLYKTFHRNQLVPHIKNHDGLVFSSILYNYGINQPSCFKNYDALFHSNVNHPNQQTKPHTSCYFDANQCTGDNDFELIVTVFRNIDLKFSECRIHGSTHTSSTFPFSSSKQKPLNEWLFLCSPLMLTNYCTTRVRSFTHSLQPS